MQGRRYDAAVLGGGPAGAAAAIALARAGVRTVVVHRDEGEGFRVGEGLPPTARPLLRDLGVIDRFDAGGHLPSYGNESAWGSPALMSTDFIRHRHGYGWHLDRPAFDAMLRDAAACNGADIIACERVATAERDDHGWTITLAGADKIRARFVIDATGRSSWLARRAGAVRVDDDALMAYVAVIETTRDDTDSLTLIEATESGWWYTALLPHGRRVVVFHTDADLLDRDFASLLRETKHIRGRSGIVDSAPFVRRANGARLNRFFGDGWAAAGDAAVSFDPLSSQGIMTALYCGLRVGDAAAAALGGDRTALDAYAATLEAIHTAHRRQHETVYAAERRWRDRPFWRRRAALSLIDEPLVATNC